MAQISRTNPWRRVALFSLLLSLVTLAYGQTEDNRGEQSSVVIDELMWAMSVNGENVLWEDADNYCAELSLDGHEDWRLPTLAELEDRYDPNRDGDIKISSPLPQTNCCLWSSTSLADQLPEEGHFYIEERKLEPSGYAWGFLYSGEGIPYYSAKYFPDGQALCVRDT